ncbi:MAG: Ig-like domain-containing protein, partial [candidate division WOR-3 bacterium]|nr:Ig-like domain-containing protein [candidate division WOR-3 bacterium]
STLRNDDWLVTCPVVVPAGANLSFWYRTSVVEDDSMEVWLSTTGNTIPDFTVMLDAFGIRTSTWTQKTISLASYAGQTVWIAFVNKGLYQWTISIDDVEIAYTPATLLWSDYTKLATVAGGGGTANVVFDPATINTEGTYQFKAWTELPGDQIPANNLMSGTFTVVTVPIELTEPQNGAVFQDRTPTFEWNEVSGATTYRIQIDNDENFTPPILINELVTGATTYTVPEALALNDGDYWWHVRAEAPGTPDPYSETRKFTVDNVPPEIPELVSPSGPINDNTPTFVWTEVSDAVLYNLVVSTAGKEEVINIETEELTYTPTEALVEGAYEWKVRAKDLAGNWSNFSDPMAFTIDITPPGIPELVSPSGLINDNTPTFEWSEVSDAVLYNLVVSTAGKEEVINIEVEGLTYTPTEALADGSYNWTVRAKDIAGNYGEFADPFELTIDATPPSAPELVSPSGFINDNTPTFVWSEVSDAVLYNLVVSTAGKVEVINIETEELTYTPTEALSDGSYNWTVRAKDIAENWGPFAEPMSFTIQYVPPAIPGWVQLESMPSPVPPKYVKDGGALTSAGFSLYAFRGNKSKEFKKYTVGTPGVWTDLETIPFGYKYKVGPPPVVDSSKYNKKVPGKGAALCWDGGNYIYATKGNGTFELWKYNLTDGHWYFEAWLPSVKGAKGGTSIFYKGGLLYVLVGGLKPEFDNFFAYDPINKTWTTLLKAPAGTAVKPWKDGSAIVAIGEKIFGLKGGDKYNSFWAYDIATNNWTEVESCPQNHPSLNKKNVVKDGGAMCTDGVVAYMIKGGGKQDFWMYTPTTNAWTHLDTIPRLHKKSVPKTGAGLAFTGGKVYLLKGNNTPEFWQYRPYDKLVMSTPKPVANSAVMTTNTFTNLTFNFDVKPNPFNKLTTIRYTVPVSGKVSIKLYNASGRLIETLTN